MSSRQQAFTNQKAALRSASPKFGNRGSRSHGLLHLQDAIGNRTVSRLLAATSGSRDPHPGPVVQAKCACGGGCPDCEKRHQVEAGSATVTSSVAPLPMEDKQEEAQIQAAGGTRPGAVQRSVEPGAPAPGGEGERPLPSAPAPVATPPAAGPTTPCPTHGDLTKKPDDMICPVATDPRASGTSVLFAQNSADLSPAALATLSSVAAAWHAGGGAGMLRIDGYASREGDDPLNWRLSCNRAMMVEAELMAPSDHSPGVPWTNIEHFAHGETTEFSCTSLPPNRRAVITTSGGAPAPGPPCGLSIIGPALLPALLPGLFSDDVDHYCAAYVSSDAPSCGVFPAPNITLTADGAAPGAALQWSIVRGTANAAIVGPPTGTSIGIRGTAPSGARGDVTVQLTDGTCTVTHRVTVREPTSMPATATASTIGPNFVQLLVIYTVLDQFKNPMGSGICWDETITKCAEIPRSIPFTFRDVATNANGQVVDQLNVTFSRGVPANLCIKLNQSITAGGCGPLVQNTIVFRPGGVTLNPGTSCAPGGACP